MSRLPMQTLRIRLLILAAVSVCLSTLLNTATWATPANIVHGQPPPDAVLAGASIPARNETPPGAPHGADPMAPPPGIIGIALHLTAKRIGDPAGLFIRATHPKGPAVKAGLTHGQEILAVDGQSITGKTYREVIAMIRGDVGAPVTLLIKTPAATDTVEIIRVGEDSLLHPDNPAAPHSGRHL